MQNKFQLEKEFLFFKKLQEYEVRYLLIGRQACIIYGLPLYTFDYDIAVENSIDNLKKILEIAESLELSPSKDKQKILEKRHPIFSLQDDIKIDVFCAKRYKTIDGDVLNFSEAFLRKEIRKDKKYKLIFYLPCIDDLIRFKKINPREKDYQDIRSLEILKKRI